MIDNKNNQILEVWGYKTFRPFRIYWMLTEFNLSFKSHKIGPRTDETKTKNYLNINPKGKIPTFRHNDIYITESGAAVNYIFNNFKKPKDFFMPKSTKEKAKLDEWLFFSLMELDCLSVYILRRHETPENYGLSNIYGEAENALKTARDYFDRMIKSCEKHVPSDSWLFGESPSVADIIFMSCFLHCEAYKLKINSDNINNYVERAKKRKQFQAAFSECFTE